MAAVKGGNLLLRTMGKMYQKQVGKSLTAYGLKYDDIVNEHCPDVDVRKNRTGAACPASSQKPACSLTALLGHSSPTCFSPSPPRARVVVIIIVAVVLVGPTATSHTLQSCWDVCMWSCATRRQLTTSQ